MKILNIKVKNFRNLDGLEFHLDPLCNFIVGENNLGKSNLLELLNTLFNHKAFKAEDFKNPAQPLEITLRIHLADVEIGHFEDLFDADDGNIINIKALQETPDDSIRFSHLESDTSIAPSTVKGINFVHYDSLRNPESEINFDKNRGVGRFLTFIIKSYLEENKISDFNFVDETQIGKLISSINEKIKKIKAFDDFAIEAAADKELETLLPKLVVLKDEKGQALIKAGYGVLFLILVTLSILERIQNLGQQKWRQAIFENEDKGTKEMSLVIGFDEPEIHLHPYMQRSLIKYLNAIISNKNDDFQTLIKELFKIDWFNGQIIVVTHSPSIILNDYQQIVRFYKKEESIRAKSGSEMQLDDQLRKHLYLQFPFIKEALFSRCVITVEGETEVSSFPVFASKLNIDFDDMGITVIQARGQSVPQVLNLSEEFGIPAVGVIDKDENTVFPIEPNLYQTNARDFEEEIVRLVDAGKENILRSIVVEYDTLGDRRTMQANALKKANSRYGLGLGRIADVQLCDIDALNTALLKCYYLSWLRICKSHPLGRLIGEKLAPEDIPQIYKDVINKAMELAKHE
jgi:putative ATP-dependent endonuclease of OLD family